jgi:NNP family nitrate/nitrite transporter-like MFS transporter
LLSAFLYFDTSFMVWVLLGALGTALGEAFNLSPAEKGWMVATPILSGSVLRLVMGIVTDRIGGRRTAILGLALSTWPLLMGWLWVDSFPGILLVGILLGVAGASFAVALPLVSRWYPAERQGLMLGIVAMGNSGTALTTLLAPYLVSSVGWRGVFGLSLIPILCVLALVIWVVRDAPSEPAQRPLRDQLAPLLLRDTYLYAAFYALTFGGLVGFAVFLPTFFRDQYGVDPARAAMFATLCAITGSLMRPVGGYLADRFGGLLPLFLVLLGTGFLGMRMSYLPHLEVATLCLLLMMAFMGIGNGAIFQLVPERFPDDLGAVTGFIGAAGGLGGFLLPMALSYSREWSERFGPGFFVIGMAGLLLSGLLIQATRDWHVHWLPGHDGSPPRNAVPAVEIGAALGGRDRI